MSGLTKLTLDAIIAALHEESTIDLPLEALDRGALASLHHRTNVPPPLPDPKRGQSMLAGLLSFAQRGEWPEAHGARTPCEVVECWIDGLRNAFGDYDAHDRVFHVKEAISPLSVLAYATLARVAIERRKPVRIAYVAALAGVSIADLRAYTRARDIGAIEGMYQAKDARRILVELAAPGFTGPVSAQPQITIESARAVEREHDT